MVLSLHDFGHVPYGAIFAKCEWYSLPIRFFVYVWIQYNYLYGFFFLFKIESFCITQAGFVV